MNRHLEPEKPEPLGEKVTPPVDKSEPQWEPCSPGYERRRKKDGTLEVRPTGTLPMFNPDSLTYPIPSMEIGETTVRLVFSQLSIYEYDMLTSTFVTVADITAGNTILVASGDGFELKKEAP